MNEKQLTESITKILNENVTLTKDDLGIIGDVVKDELASLFRFLWIKKSFWKGA